MKYSLIKVCDARDLLQKWALCARLCVPGEGAFSFHCTERHACVHACQVTSVVSDSLQLMDYGLSDSLSM